MAKKVTDRLSVSINSPDAVIWKGPATSISSRNSVGIFDILPGHANFITMVQNEPIVVRFAGKEMTFKYENAVLFVYEESVTIYVEV